MKISKQTLDILNEEGYVDLEDYLHCLVEDYCIDYEEVVALAELLGENELFDGLLSMLDDVSN